MQETELIRQYRRSPQDVATSLSQPYLGRKDILIDVYIMGWKFLNATITPPTVFVRFQTTLIGHCLPAWRNTYNYITFVHNRPCFKNAGLNLKFWQHVV